MEVRTLTKYVLTHGTFREVDTELCHRRVSTMTKQTKKDFKYYAKVTTGKTTRYFYTKEEWLAYRSKERNKAETEADKKPGPAKTISFGDVAKRLTEAMQKKVARYIKDLQEADDADKNVPSDAETAETAESTETTDVPESENKPEGDWSKDLKHKDPTLTKEEDQAAVNPNYTAEYGDPYSNNCAFCTTAYELRRRGYDVEAMPYDESITPPPNIHGISLLYENTAPEDWSRASILDVDDSDGANGQYADAIRDLWSDSPDGSYGQLSVMWNAGGGHNLFWEKEDGEVIIRDCQTNEIFNLNEKAHEFSYLTNSVYALRTDNRQPTSDITNYVRNKEEKNR